MSDNTNDNKDKESRDKWYTITEASQILGVSRRTVQRHIQKGEIESKLVGRIRLVRLDTRTTTATNMSYDMSLPVEQLQKENKDLRQQIEYLKEQTKEKDKQIGNLQEQLDATSEASQQQNAIIMQLTRQLEQSQRLLEYHQSPWWRRIFRHKE